MKKSSLITQAAIFFLPALIATLLFQINPDITSPIGEFLFYRCGLSGICLAGFLYVFFQFSKSLAFAITVLLYSAIFFFLYLSFYKNSKKQMRLFCYVNIALSIWGIVSGSFWLGVSML